MKYASARLIAFNRSTPRLSISTPPSSEGGVSFSSIVLLPQILQTRMAYTAQEAGMVISVAAILLFFLLPGAGGKVPMD